ncbi:MAG TPA: RDD family protein [Mycobacteriales bacterium]|nr:RDD family protein [Mycobacteriales bacterium]
MTAEQTYPGQRLGLPAEGPGSIATQGKRLLGTLLDLVAAVILGGVVLLFDPHVSAGIRGLVNTGAYVAEVVLLTTFTGQSIGMRFVHTKMLWRDGGNPPLRWALFRMALTILPFPYLLTLLLDEDTRGLHDRGAGTVVVNAAPPPPR